MEFNRTTFKESVGDAEFSLEFSPLAEQANASVIARTGNTVVLAAVVMGKEDRNTDFFPLTVDYEERFYAAGRIMGSRFMRREGRPSEDAILSGRLVDRAIRPLFDHRLRRDTQVVLTILSYDSENDPDVVSLLAASAALAVSDIPWNGPVAGIRVARIDGKIVLNPTASQLQNGAVAFHAFVAGTGETINMIELEGSEAAEEEIVAAFESALPEVRKLVAFQQKIVGQLGKPKTSVALAEHAPALVEAVRTLASREKLADAMFAPELGKQERQARMDALKADVCATLRDQSFSDADIADVGNVLDEEVDALLHERVLEKAQRPDGRALDEVRPLHIEVGLLERMHGSALFVRGNTQALAVTTLAPPGSEQLIESIESTGKRHFLLHYNFPKYSVGETGAMRGPGRREIGHGALAEKALRAVLPSREDFPYTIRIVSEILSSNGSSSMATVCSGSLSLMDAGVPISKPVAGIAMGLIIDPADAFRYKVLTDIQGPEDHHGDMDFKVAGTADGVTAIQMDVKVNGVPLAALADGLTQAREARLHILNQMNAVLERPRETQSVYAPKITTISIDPERIGEVIGPGGKIINAIIARTGATIDIEEDGTIFVAGTSAEAVEQAVNEIRSIVRDFTVGEIVEGEVVRILEFGAIVDIGGGRDGMIHVSELKKGYVENVQDVVNEGDHVRAKIVRVENGKIGLSLKQLDA